MRSVVFLRIAGGLCLLTIGVVAVVEEGGAIRRRDAQAIADAAESKRLDEETTLARAAAERRMRVKVVTDNLDADREAVWGAIVRHFGNEIAEADKQWDAAMAKNDFQAAHAATKRRKDAEYELDYAIPERMRAWEAERLKP